MTKSNKTHPLIAREALMAGITKMKEWKPEEKSTFTQKEAVEMLAEAARDQLAKGRSIGQVVIAIRASIGLTIGDDTVRSYLRTALAANDAAAMKTPTTRRGRKVKPVTTVTDDDTVEAGPVEVSAADEIAAVLDGQDDHSTNDQGHDAGRDCDATGADADAVGGDAPKDKEDDFEPIDAIVAQLPPMTEDAKGTDATDDAGVQSPTQTVGKAPGLRDLLPQPTYRYGGQTQ